MLNTLNQIYSAMEYTRICIEGLDYLIHQSISLLTHLTFINETDIDTSTSDLKLEDYLVQFQDWLVSQVQSIRNGPVNLIKRPDLREDTYKILMFGLTKWYLHNGFGFENFDQKEKLSFQIYKDANSLRTDDFFVFKPKLEFIQKLKKNNSKRIADLIELDNLQVFTLPPYAYLTQLQNSYFANEDIFQSTRNQRMQKNNFSKAKYYLIRFDSYFQKLKSSNFGNLLWGLMNQRVNLLSSWRTSVNSMYNFIPSEFQSMKNYPWNIIQRKSIKQNRKGLAQEVTKFNRKMKYKPSQIFELLWRKLEERGL